MKISKLQWALIGGISTIAIASGIYVKKQGLLLYNSCYAMSGAIINKLDIFNKVDITLLIKLKNDSDISFSVKKQYYEVFFNDFKVSVVKSDKVIEVPAKSTITIPVSVIFNPKDFLKAGVKNLTEIVTDSSKIKIKTKGKLSVKLGLLTIPNIPIETVYTIAELTAPTSADNPCKNFK